MPHVGRAASSPIQFSPFFTGLRVQQDWQRALPCRYRSCRGLKSSWPGELGDGVAVDEAQSRCLCAAPSLTRNHVPFDGLHALVAFVTTLCTEMTHELYAGSLQLLLEPEPALGAGDDELR